MSDQSTTQAAATRKCAFRFSGDEICRREAQPGGDRCTLHQRDRTPEQVRALDSAVAAMLKDKEYDFRGVVFPENFGMFAGVKFDDVVSFERARFQGDADFRRTIFAANAKFGNVLIRGDAKFSATRFAGNAQFLGARIGGDARFTETDIEGAALFSALDVGGAAQFSNARVGGLIQFGNARISRVTVFAKADIGGSAGFAHTRMGGDVDFSSAAIGGECDFSFVTINGDAQFGGARLGRDVLFREARIAGTALFRGAIIKGHARFRGARVGRNAMFSNVAIFGNAEFPRMDIGRRAYFSRAHIRGGADFHAINIGMFAHFANASFDRSADFRGASLPPAGDFRKISIKMGKGESLCRFAKQVCHNMGEYREGGEWHFRERCHHWYARTFLRKGSKRILALINPLTWVEYFVGRLVFGYGENPTCVIIAALLVILGAAVAYDMMEGLWHSMTQETSTNFLDSLYFSVVTFTTLGFGDYQARPQSSVRYVAMAEAMAGSFLMALFVVTLARRWGRG